MTPGGRVRGHPLLHLLDSPWQALGDLLDEPQVAVGVSERAEGSVAGALRVDTGLARFDGERRAVPDVAYRDSEVGQRAVGLLDVRNDEIALARAGRGRG